MNTTLNEITKITLTEYFLGEKRMKTVIAAAVLAVTLGLVSPAQATNNGNGPCPGHFFCGEQGPKGEQGIAGKNGKDGRDGIDGINGTNGEDGNDLLSIAAIREVEKDMKRQGNIDLAFDSIEIFLPQQKKHRITLNHSDNGYESANGLGYAYMFDGDNRTAIHFGLGEADSERVYKLGISFEF